MWFFDSWSVLDGLAFASLREPDSIKADDTVFLSVPDLEPVPVGRISTALRAQRSGFQDGFRNREGDEFEFDNLDQICEVIRRGYLAGGLGPVPAPLEGPPPSPFRGEPEVPEPPPVHRDGGEHYDQEVERLSPEAPPYDLSKLSEKRHREKLLLQDVFGKSNLLQRYLRAFAEATVFEYIQARRRDLHQPYARGTFLKWLRILHALDLWSFETADHFELRWIYDHFFQIYGPWNSTHWEKEILFQIPCPLRNTWDHHIGSLGQKLLLPLVDQSYYTDNKTIPEFIPALFCAMIAVLTPDLAVSRNFSEIDQRRLIGRACEWLNAQLPQIPLPSAVEEALSELAWNRISLNPERPRRTGRGRALAR
jgi:hypothetical protein